MSEYYYLAASLPSLHWEGSPPLGSGDFLEQCARLMSPGDFILVRDSRLDALPPPASPAPLFRKWQAAEAGLRNELARLRAKKLNADPEPHLRKEHLDPLAAPRAREIFDAENPLRAELALNRFRWNALNELETGHYFDCEFLIAYYLKLQILERNASFKPETGKQKLSSVLRGEN